MKITAETANTALIALNECLEREQSLTARLRIRAAVRDLESIHPDTDEATPQEHRSKPFQLTELFAWYEVTPNYHECGCLINNGDRDLHREWHNKIADLA